MLRHPAPWGGLLLTVLSARDIDPASWASAQYQGLQSSLTPLLLGISLAAASAFGREHVAVSDDAPVEPIRRSLARLLGALPLVGLMVVVIVAAAVWLRSTGGLGLGDEPGRTEHAYY